MALSDSFSSHTRASRGAPWQRAYEAVLTENDTPTLFKLVEAAEAAVLTRRSELEGNPDHHSETKALEKAAAHLQVLKRERLKFRWK